MNQTKQMTEFFLLGLKAQFFKKDTALKNLRYAIDRYGETTGTLIKRYSECEKPLTGNSRCILQF